MSDNLKLFNFLEKEHKRINSLYIFFSSKIVNLVKYSQIEALIRDQKINQEKTETKLIQNLCRPESFTQKQMANIFNQMFGDG